LTQCTFFYLKIVSWLYGFICWLNCYICNYRTIFTIDYYGLILPQNSWMLHCNLCTRFIQISYITCDTFIGQECGNSFICDLGQLVKGPRYVSFSETQSSIIMYGKVFFFLYYVDRHWRSFILVPLCWLHIQQEYLSQKVTWYTYKGRQHICELNCIDYYYLFFTTKNLHLSVTSYFNIFDPKFNIVAPELTNSW
jgi:hypothetical protein